MESVQRSPLCIMVIGSVLAGAIVGFRSSKPVGLTGAIIISCLMLPLAWLSMTHPVPILRIPIFIAYGVAISTVVLNTFIWYRSRKSSEHIIANPEEIPILNLREKVRSLLKDGRLFPRQPAVRSLKYAQVHFQDSPVRMHAYCKPSGVYFYASSGIEGADPSAPGTEFLPIAVVWLFIPWANIETLKTEHIIGYSEVALRLKNSGLQLRLEGLTRKQLAQFDSLQIPDFQLKLKTE